MIFAFSRLESMVYHVLFIASFLNLPTLFLSTEKDSGIPLVGMNARINIQYKAKTSLSSSSSGPQRSTSSSGSQRYQSKPSSSSGSQGGNKPRPQSVAGSNRSKEPEEDEDGFTKVSHKPKATKPQQNSWWSGSQTGGQGKRK